MRTMLRHFELLPTDTPGERESFRGVAFAPASRRSSRHRPPPARAARHTRPPRTATPSRTATQVRARRPRRAARSITRRWSRAEGGVARNSHTPLAGQTIVITGAASGIGRALAERLAAHGSPVAIVD